MIGFFLNVSTGSASVLPMVMIFNYFHFDYSIRITKSKTKRGKNNIKFINDIHFLLFAFH